MKKKLLAILALAFTATLSVGATQAITASANAEPTAITLNQATITLDDTASVRMDAPYGIRFDAFLSAEQYAGLKKTYETVEVGMLICPTDFITEGKTLDFDDSDGLVLENAPEQNNPEFGYVAIPEEQFVLDSKTNTYTIHGALVGIHQNNLSRPFTARAYIRAFDSEGNEVTDAPVYSATTTSRAIYSVATYAVADPEVDFTGDKAACKTFLNEIIDEVQAYYGNLTVSVTSDNTQTQEYGILNDGDKVTVSATVTKNGDSTRVLDACPVLSAAAESGITLTQTSKNEYVINGLNETGYNLSAAVGVTGETNTHTVSGIFTTPVKSWEKDIIDDVQTLNAANATFTLQEEGDFAGAYAWSTSNDNGKVLRLPALTKGDIVTFDFYAPTMFLVIAGFNNVSYLIYNNNGTQNKDCYPVAGATISDESGNELFAFRYLFDDTQTVVTQAIGNYTEQWISVEITAKQNFAEGKLDVRQHSSFAITGFYLRDFKVQRYTLGYTEQATNLTEFDVFTTGGMATIEKKTLDNRGVAVKSSTSNVAFSENGKNNSIAYQDTGDFAGAYKYQPAAFNNATNAAFSLTADGKNALIKEKMYFYVSMYQDKTNGTEKFNLRLCFNGYDFYLYNGTQTTSAGYQINVYTYDTEGNPVLYSSGVTGNKSNQWVTFEICIPEGATVNTANSATYLTVISATESAGTAYCYLRNVQFSATQKTLKLSDLQGA